jgi:hypothetical protein
VQLQTLQLLDDASCLEFFLVGVELSLMGRQADLEDLFDRLEDRLYQVAV